MTSTAGSPPGAEAALADLRRRWGDTYEIARADRWTARVPGEADMLTASTAAELETLMRHDYSDRQAGTNMGQGERALRQLRDDGVI